MKSLEHNFELAIDTQSLSPQKLAFVGDAVFELMIRQKLVEKLKINMGELNKAKTMYVCCTAQAELFDKIIDILDDTELKILKRGRNAHVNGTPKKVSASVYHKATGVEALIGFLYLKGDFSRLNKVVNMMNF